MTNGHLRLSPLEPERGRRVVVDLFFRSLADAHGPRATAVVLSGADGDGAIGIKRIKERGGLGTWRWDLRARLVWGDPAFLALWDMDRQRSLARSPSSWTGCRRKEQR